MKDTKATQQMKTILSVLMNKEKVTTKDLANAVNLSEKTVRIRLNDLHDYLLKENLGKIERKTRVGVWLETNPKNEHALWDLVSTTQDIHDDNSRVHVIVKKFLMNPEESFTLNQLSDDLYLSPSTVSRVMDETEKWFKTNKIMFNRTQNRGHWIEFNEVEYRNAYMRLITILSKNETPEQLVSEYFPGVNLKVIKNIVNRAIINSKINPSDSTINNLLIMLSLVIYRNISSHSVTDFYSNALQEYSEYAFMENVVKELEDATNIKIHENEIAYLTVFFIAGG